MTPEEQKYRDKIRKLLQLADNAGATPGEAAAAAVRALYLVEQLALKIDNKKPRKKAKAKMADDEEAFSVLALIIKHGNLVRARRSRRRKLLIDGLDFRSLYFLADNAFLLLVHTVAGLIADGLGG